MTESSTTRFGLTIATADGDAGPTHTTYSADNQNIEDLAAIRKASTRALRPAATAALEGTFHAGTDVFNVSYCDGTSWYDLLPPGITLPYAGTTAPPGWLLCDGSAVSRTTYAALFGVLGTTFGSGDGSTTFNLPDMRNRITRGSNAAAGGAPSPLLPGAMATGHYDGGDAHDHGTNTGSTVLSATQIPSHGHPAAVTDPSHGHPGSSVANHQHSITDQVHHHEVDAGGHGVATGTSFVAIVASGQPTTANPVLVNNSNDSYSGINHTEFTQPGLTIIGSTTGISVAVNGQTGTTGQGHTHTITSQAALYPPSLSLAHIIKA